MVYKNCHSDHGHWMIKVMIRSSGEELGESGGGNQIKKTLVFHGLAPEKNETGIEE